MKKLFATALMSAVFMAGFATAEEQKHHASVPNLAKAATSGDHKPHWTYEGEHGALHWGDMEGNAVCKIGQAQSPINIPTKAAKTAPLNPIIFNYTLSNGEIINNGHTIQVNLKSGNSIMLDGVRFELLQFHFHAPSEEGFDNVRYPLVAHFVHKSAEGKLAVVALLFAIGNENQILKNIFANIPADESTKNELSPLALNALFAPNLKYYSFMGSLTTPPCSEGVKWQVLKVPAEISLAQLVDFKYLYPMNARPFQPINSRDIKIGE